jgi:hypothetical protein
MYGYRNAYSAKREIVARQGYSLPTASFDVEQKK